MFEFQSLNLTQQIALLSIVLFFLINTLCYTQRNDFARYTNPGCTAQDHTLLVRVN